MPRAARTPDELPTPAEAAGMPGLEFMTAILEGRLAGPPIGPALGFDLAEVEAGRVAFRGAARFEMANPLGGVHGGWYGVLLDSAMTCAVSTRLPAGRLATTLEYKVNVVRALGFDHPVTATRWCEAAGRQVAVARGEIRDAEGRLYATGSTTCLIRPTA